MYIIQHVKNQLERTSDQFTTAWKWRVAEEGKDNNGLSEGEDGHRVLAKVKMATRKSSFEDCRDVVANSLWL